MLSVSLTLNDFNDVLFGNNFDVFDALAAQQHVVAAPANQTLCDVNWTAN